MGSGAGVRMAKDRPPCAGLWNTPMVQVNGDVTTCWLDEHLENVIGNLNESTLGELWNGETMNQWRQAQIEGRFDDSGPLCPRCNWESAGAYPEDKVAAWVAKFKANR